jgi:hypothetical protein
MYYVICSYHRADLIKARTLSLFASHNVPNHQVFIFVGAANDNDFEPYNKLTEEGYTLVRCPVGLTNAHNAVRDHFADGEELIMCDDDLKDILHLFKGEKWNLTEEFARGFHYARQSGSRLVGIYPVNCRLWMSPKITFGASFAYGCCFGIINEKAFTLTKPVKEDWERSLFFNYRDGGFVLIQYLAPVQKFRTESGGQTSTRTKLRELEVASALVEQYPGLVRLTERKGWAELQLNRKLVLKREVLYELPAPSPPSGQPTP